jgi:hypothetical protein
MRDVMLWVQSVQGMPWAGVAALLIFRMPLLLAALCESLAKLTAMRSSDPERRANALRILKSLTKSQPVRPRRRRGKNS